MSGDTTLHFIQKIRTTTATEKRQLIWLIYYVSLDIEFFSPFFLTNFIFLTISYFHRGITFPNDFKNDFITKTKNENRFLCVIRWINTKIIIQIVNIKLNKCSIQNTHLSLHINTAQHSVRMFACLFLSRVKYVYPRRCHIRFIEFFLLLSSYMMQLSQANQND